MTLFEPFLNELLEQDEKEKLKTLLYLFIGAHFLYIFQLGDRKEEREIFMNCFADIYDFSMKTLLTEFDEFDIIEILKWNIERISSEANCTGS